MPIEIERRFLINVVPWNQSAGYADIKQGYLSIDPHAVVRVRSQVQPGKDPIGYITVKGRQIGISRTEYEYEIPAADANQMINTMCVAALEKRRYFVNHGQKFWTVDVFGGKNHGLWLAEIELSTDDEEIELPAWIGTEVTKDSKYSNVNLALNPYQLW